MNVFIKEIIVVMRCSLPSIINNILAKSSNRPLFKLWFGLMLNVPVNNFSVMLGRSHRFLGITSTFFFAEGHNTEIKMLTCKIFLRKFIHKVSGIISFDCHCYYSDTQQHSTCKLGNARKRKMNEQLERLHLLDFYHTNQ